MKENIFKFLFCCFGALGCTMQLGAVLDFSDAMVFFNRAAKYSWSVPARTDFAFRVEPLSRAAMTRLWQTLY